MFWVKLYTRTELTMAERANIVAQSRTVLKKKARKFRLLFLDALGDRKPTPVSKTLSFNTKTGRFNLNAY